MSKDAMICTTGDQETIGLNAGVTQFHAVANCGRYIINGTEAQAQTKTKAGVIDLLRFFVVTTTSGEALTVGIRINGTNGNTTAQQTLNTTGAFEDLTHSDTVADADLLVTRFTGNATANSCSISGATQFHFVATGNIATMYSFAGNNTFTATALGTDYFFTVLGGYHAGLPGTSETNVQQKVRSPGALTGLRVDIITNSKTGTSTFTFRTGAAAGNQTVSYATTVTGIVEDTTHTDTIASTDLIDIRLNTQTPNNLNGTVIAVVFVGSNQQMDCATEATSGQGSTTVVQFVQTVGYAGTEATEANRQQKIRWTSSFDHFRGNVISNSSTGFTWTFRLNGADGSQTFTVGSSATGQFEDATHHDSVASGDLVDEKLSIVSNTSTQTSTMVTMGLTSNNAAIATVFGGISQELDAAVVDQTHIATVFGRFSQEVDVDVEATFHGPIATVFGLFSQVVNATDLGAAGGGIRQFWTF